MRQLYSSLGGAAGAWRPEGAVGLGEVVRGAEQRPALGSRRRGEGPVRERAPAGAVGKGKEKMRDAEMKNSLFVRKYCCRCCSCCGSNRL